MISETDRRRLDAWGAKHGKEQGQLIFTDQLPGDWDLAPGDSFASVTQDGIRMRFNVLSADHELKVADVHIREEAVE